MLLLLHEVMKIVPDGDEDSLASGKDATLPSCLRRPSGVRAVVYNGPVTRAYAQHFSTELVPALASDLFRVQFDNQVAFTITRSSDRSPRCSTIACIQREIHSPLPRFVRIAVHVAHIDKTSATATDQNGLKAKCTCMPYPLTGRGSVGLPPLF